MPVKPPAHTCPWIDQLATLVRRNMRGEDRRRGLALCEQLRGANLQLRVSMVDALGDADDLRHQVAALERALDAATHEGSG
jgi:hypothetical protein